MWLKHSIFSVLFVLAALPAQAQTASEGTRTFIRGTVEKLDGHSLAV